MPLTVPPCHDPAPDQEFAGAVTLARMYAESLRRTRARLGPDQAAADLTASLTATYTRDEAALLAVAALSLLADTEDRRSLARKEQS